MTVKMTRFKKLGYCNISIILFLSRLLQWHNAMKALALHSLPIRLIALKGTIGNSSVANQPLFRMMMKRKALLQCISHFCRPYLD